MANGGIIGSAVIEVTVDSSKIRAGMNSATGNVRQNAGAVAAASDRVGTTAKKQLSDFTAGVARFGAVTGTFYTFLRLGQQIGEMLKSGTERAKEFTNALDTRSTGDALAKINAEIAEIEGRIDNASSSAAGYVTNRVFGDTPAKMQAQLEELRKTAGVLQQFENSKTQKARGDDARKKRDAEIQANKEIRAEASKDADAAILDNLQGVEKVNEEERRFFEDLERRRNKSQDLEYQQALGRYSIAKQIYFIDQRRTIEAEKQAKINEERDKATEQSMRRQLEIAEEINGIKQASVNDSLRMVTGIEDLGQKLDVLIMQQRSMQR